MDDGLRGGAGRGVMVMLGLLLTSGCGVVSGPRISMLVLLKLTRKLTQVSDQVDPSSVLGYAERMVCHARAAADVTEHEDVD